MPVVLRIKGYRVWFYEADLNEPPHVHVGKAGNEAKFWMTPIALAKARGFHEHELNEIRRMLMENQGEIIAAWHKENEKHGNR